MRWKRKPLQIQKDYFNELRLCDVESKIEDLIECDLDNDKEIKKLKKNQRRIYILKVILIIFFFCSLFFSFENFKHVDKLLPLLDLLG